MAVQIKIPVGGDVAVTGDLRLTHADCAEDFDMAEAGGKNPAALSGALDAVYTAVEGML